MTDSAQITPPDDWVGELDAEYIEKWTAWVKYRNVFGVGRKTTEAEYSRWWNATGYNIQHVSDPL